MMEDDDEFGDLYSDVLAPISPFQSHHNPSRSEPAPPPIDNTATNACAISSDDGGMLCSPFNSISCPNLNRDPKLNIHPSVQTHENSFNHSSVSQDPLLIGSHELGGISADSPPDSPLVKVDQTRVLDQSVASKDAEFVDNDDNLQVQIKQGDEDGPVIPGISVAQPNDGALNPNGVSQVEANSEGDDWESDSDDDLQIVLNENGPSVTHQYQGPVVMGEITGVEVDEDDDDEDEDGEPLVIVSDTDAVHHPPPEDKADQAPDGVMKDTGEIGKANGGVPLPPKIGNNNYAYHSYHSQFKYVRPGAAPLPGGSGQVRPTVNVGSVVGGGRGDWRQAGLKGPLQNGLQSGFWGSNASGRAFGGDFALPSQKIIFDISIDSFEEKRWNHPDTDVSDFFNFGLNEDSWKGYCKKLEQLRMESTMKSKAYVLVVGSQSDQEYDPDLPPELAAAAAGIQVPSTENSNAQRADVGNTDIARGTGVLRAPLPTGRPIQVEVGSGERFPSSDTRPPRMRDLDTVIEIVLQGTVDDASSAGYGAVDQPGNDGSREDLRDNAVEEDGKQTRNAYSDGYPESINCTKKEVNPKEHIPEDESSLHPEAPIEHFSGSRENSPVYLSDKFEVSPRRMKGEIHKRSRSTAPVESAVDEKLFNDKEVMSENLEGKDSPHVLSLEERVLSDDEPSQSEGNSHKDNEDLNLIENTLDTTEHHHTKPVKLVSQGEHMKAKENSDVSYIKADRSSDNSRATGSSLDLQKESICKEHSPHPRDLKSNRHEDVCIHHRNDCNGNLETEKINMLGKRRERDYAIGTLQLQGEDLHGRKYRAEDSRKHEHSDVMIARHRGKVREGERSNKDEYLPSRKMMENGNWRGHREKEAGFRIKEKDEILSAHRDKSSHRKRKRDESLDHQQLDAHCLIRSKDEREGSYKDTGRNGEQLKKKDSVQKPTVRSAHPSVTQKVHERRPKENSRKSRQPEGGQRSTSNSSKKPQEEKGGRNEMAGLIGTVEEGKRGRSKLERWTSHEGMNYSVKSKLSSSAKVTDEPVKKSQVVDVSDSATKLKKRSERFKAPMPIAKDTSSTVKKTEGEAPMNSDIKQERLPRKRRWIGKQ